MKVCVPYADSGRLAQLQVEAIGGRIRIHRDAFTVYAPVFAAVCLQVHQSLLGALHQNRLVGGLVAFQLEIAGRAVADKALLTFKYKYGSAENIIF